MRGSGSKKKYRLIDHTADVGVDVTGTDLSDLFCNCAFALFDLITDPAGVASSRVESVQVEGSDLGELLVNWLNELLFLFESKDTVFSKFQIDSLNETRLEGRAWGEVFDPDRHEIRGEIKAATFHQLKVEEADNQWHARVIFDL